MKNKLCFFIIVFGYALNSFGGASWATHNMQVPKLNEFTRIKSESKERCFVALTNGLLKAYDKPNTVVTKQNIPERVFATYGIPPNSQPYYKVSFDVVTDRNGLKTEGSGKANVFFIKRSSDVWECGISEQGRFLADQSQYDAYEKWNNESERDRITYKAAMMFNLERADLLTITSKNGDVFRLYGLELRPIENPEVASENQQKENDRLELMDKKRKNAEQGRRYYEQMKDQPCLGCGGMGGGMGGGGFPVEINEGDLE